MNIKLIPEVAGSDIFRGGHIMWRIKTFD